MMYGVSPIAWTNDDLPSLGGDTPLETCLNDARDIGFDGVELGGKFPREASALRPLLERAGLALIGGWYSSNLLVRSAEAEIAFLQPHLALLKALDCNVFVIAETSNATHTKRGAPMRERPSISDAQWRTFGARLSEVADYLDSAGFRLAYHHHLGTIVERQSDFDTFLEVTTGKVGLTFDTGHAAAGGVDSAAFLRDHPARLVHLHCKDVRNAVLDDIRGAGKSFLDGVIAGMFTVPGDGDLDFAPVFSALKTIGYDGWIVVEAEQDPAIANPKDYSALGLETLKALARDAGLGA